MNRIARVPSALVLLVLTAGCGPKAPRDPSPTGDGTGPTRGTMAEVGEDPEVKGAPFEATGGIPPQVVASWEKAGARFGWLVSDPDPIGSPDFAPSRSPDRPSLPAFQFTGEGEFARTLRDLPAPPAAFGLDFSKTPFADADAKALRRFRHLRALKLLGTKVRGAGLKELAGLPRLQTLILNATQITDADLQALAAVPRLRSLSVGATDIGDEGLKNLAGLKELDKLRLFGTKITDRGLRHLTALKKLQTLDLHITRVSDAGLKELAWCKQLRAVFVALTNVTGRGMGELRQALPGCEVRR